MRPSACALLVGVVLPVLVACGNAGKRDASALVNAVDRYRRAEGPSKDALGQAVSVLACADSRVCDAKQACVAAIEPTTRALLLKDEVARRLVDLEAKRLATDSPEVQALPGKLDEAERLLRDGRARMAACDARLTDLRVAFGV